MEYERVAAETPLFKKGEVQYINEDDRPGKIKMKGLHVNDNSGKKSFMTMNSGGSN